MELSQIDLLKTKALLVYLDRESEVNPATDVNVFYLKPGDLLSRQTVRDIRKSEPDTVTVTEGPEFK